MAKISPLLAVGLLILGAALGASIKATETEYIAGHVLYRVVGGQIEYVLVQKVDELDDWSVPKGHIEAGEDTILGAQRETFEETSLLVEDYAAFYNKSISFEYTTNADILKKVTVFPAKLTNLEKPVVVDPNEHNAYVWVNYQNGLAIIKKQYRNAFTEANNFIVAQEQ